MNLETTASLKDNFLKILAKKYKRESPTSDEHEGLNSTRKLHDSSDLSPQIVDNFQPMREIKTKVVPVE